MDRKLIEYCVTSLASGIECHVSFHDCWLIIENSARTEIFAEVGFMDTHVIIQTIADDGCFQPTHKLCYSDPDFLDLLAKIIKNEHSRDTSTERDGLRSRMKQQSDLATLVASRPELFHERTSNKRRVKF